MKVLVDINHPAHVHLFRNLIHELRKNGHDVVVTASDKDIAFELLRLYNLPYMDLGSYGRSVSTKLLNVPVMAAKMLRVALKEKPDLMIGMASSRITHAGFVTGIKTFVFTDTEHAKEQILLFRPFATRIYTPTCFLSDLGSKQVRYPSYHELAYLHPDRFTANDRVLEMLGISHGQKVFVVRFVSWNASHDLGQSGLSIEGKNRLVDMLRAYGRVVITSEGELPEALEAYRLRVPADLIHDLLYYADMYVGEGGTMASEAAVLGTPSVWVSTLKLGYLEELNHRFNLLVQCHDYQSTIEAVSGLLRHSNLREEWRRRHKAFIACKIDATKYMLDEIQALGDSSYEL